MKKSLIIALSAGAVLTAGFATTAAAAPGQAHAPSRPSYDAPRAQTNSTFSQRQAELERRIEAGLRNGGLSRTEAARLRTELRQVQQLETRYRRGGLTRQESAELDRRLDRLSAKIRVEQHQAPRQYSRR